MSVTFLDLLEEHFKEWGMAYWLIKHDLVQVKENNGFLFRTFYRALWESPRNSLSIIHDSNFVYVSLDKGPYEELCRIADPQCFPKINSALEKFVDGLKVSAY